MTLERVGAGGAAAGFGARVDSYRRLTDVFHHVLSEQSPDGVLDRIADTLADLVPYDTLTIYEASEKQGLLIPVIARDRWATEILNDRVAFGEGLTGWAVANREPVFANDAHLDPRVEVVPGTPLDAESLICIPLVARGSIKGALNIYRLGEGSRFSDDDFDLARRFGDAAALALDNAHVRAFLEHEAQTDSLTGLFNHRYFQERLRTELTRASRMHDSVALLLFDIDDFKRVNDVHGHGVGDHVLVTIGEILRQTVRDYDVACRIGGEEFAVVLPSCDGADALSLADRLINKVRTADFDVAGRLTISVGVAHGPEHGMNPRELIGSADTAMLTAKSRGKDRAVLFADHGLEEFDRSIKGVGGRSISHLKMLHGLAGKLNRLNDVRQIAMTIANELRTLIDYHNCRVYLREGDLLFPIAYRGELAAYEEEKPEFLACHVGEGITGRAAESGRSVFVPDAVSCDFAVHIPGTVEIDESIIATPLCYGKRAIGAVTISKLGVDQFDEDDVRLLEVLAGQASVALENARLYEAQRHEAERAKEIAAIANALLDFGRDLSTAAGLDEVLDHVVESAARTLGSSYTSVWLQEEEGDDLRVEALWGYDQRDRFRMAALRIDGPALQARIEPGTPLIVQPAELQPLIGRSALVDGLAWWVAPLNLDGRLGFIVAALPDLVDVDRDRKSRLLVGMAHQAKLAITNAVSYESLEETFYSTVEALANALEAKDEYTSSHARSITDMALAVGRELGFGPRRLKRLELAALFHDIGKIGIPSEILIKPGPLTDEEREIMKTHPELGASILAPIKRLADVRPIVRACHEHHDGSGYPDGLAGDEIPIEARIILVVDAFDAMTTDRPYRARLTTEEACSRLRKESGRQFDPVVTEAFLGILQSQPSLGYGA